MFIEKRKKKIKVHVLKGRNSDYGLCNVLLDGQNYPVVFDIKPYWLNWLNSN